MVRFGSSGIRGLANVDVIPELALDVGRAIGALYGDVVVGRDPRLSGRMLSYALQAGVLAVGGGACDAGITSTPTLARGVGGYGCGAVITASHNPGEYNGIKLWNPDGMAFSTEQQEEVERSLDARDWKAARWDETGRHTERADLPGRHREAILRAVGSAEVHVVVDCGCGATANVTPYVLREMGCKVTALNAQMDGHFPGREPEPTEANLAALRTAVPALGADLGIAHDGDGDRMVAVDEKGAFVGGDKLLALFAKQRARRGLVVPVDASMAFDDALDVPVYRTRVGDVYVAQEIKRRGADFGGEPSGTFIFPSETMCPDGPLAAAILVSLVKERPMKQWLAEIPAYPIVRSSIPFEAAARTAVLGSMGPALATLHADEVTTVDGWRLAFSDGWALVRLSGTEPRVRVTAEAREVARAKEIHDRVSEAVRRALP
ncbi:MAG TPA: phosphoglucosamine mutase [Thermoplasmata archaeon]|nr:phosphoglucosamine mutase [Thermoplasmata archaeon]